MALFCPSVSIAETWAEMQWSGIVSRSHSPSPPTEQPSIGLYPPASHWAVPMRSQSYTHKDTDPEER